MTPAEFLDSTREACEDDRRPGETAIPVLDAANHDHVRPARWLCGYATLGITDLGKNRLRLHWKDGPPPNLPPAKSTVFGSHEWVLVR